MLLYEKNAMKERELDSEKVGNCYVVTPTHPVLVKNCLAILLSLEARRVSNENGGNTRHQTPRPRQSSPITTSSIVPLKYNLDR